MGARPGIPAIGQMSSLKAQDGLFSTIPQQARRLVCSASGMGEREAGRPLDGRDLGRSPARAKKGTSRKATVAFSQGGQLGRYKLGARVSMRAIAVRVLIVAIVIGR